MPEYYLIIWGDDEAAMHADVAIFSDEEDLNVFINDNIKNENFSVVKGTTIHPPSD